VSHSTTYVILGALIVFSIYRRVRRTVSFQPLRKSAFTVRIILFILVGVLYLSGGARHPVLFAFDALGLLIGAIFAYFAIRTTVFEQRGDRWFFRTNRWIGITLVTLFLLRFVYRMVLVYNMSSQQIAAGQPVANAQAYTVDPLTSVVLFMLVSYYIAYYVSIMRKEKHLGVDAEGKLANVE